MAGKRDEVTIAEVAEALNISKTTVSRAISGKGRVSEATRARVFDYIGKGRQDAAAPPMWPGFHADQVRARGKRPSVRLELGEIRAILAARKEHSPMPRSPIRIRRDGLVRG